jgi:hypothetical protein
MAEAGRRWTALAAGGAVVGVGVALGGTVAAQRAQPARVAHPMAKSSLTTRTVVAQLVKQTRRLEAEIARDRVELRSAATRERAALAGQRRALAGEAGALATREAQLRQEAQALATEAAQLQARAAALRGLRVPAPHATSGASHLAGSADGSADT